MAAESTDALRDGLVLIVEDNFAIAFDLEDALKSLGFTNCVAFSHAADATEFLENQTPVFALLDVHLGQGSTSQAIAAELVQRDVRVVFITGYGDQIDMPPPLSDLPVLNKPVSRDELAAFLAKMDV